MHRCTFALISVLSLALLPHCSSEDSSDDGAGAAAGKSGSTGGKGGSGGSGTGGSGGSAGTTGGSSTAGSGGSTGGKGGSSPGGSGGSGDAGAGIGGLPIGGSPGAGGAAQGGPFKLTSSAFNDGASIPDKYSCNGTDKAPGHDPSPPLAWGPGENAPKGYAIIFYDRGASGTGNKLHWIIWDIPASVTSLPEGIPDGYDIKNPTGAKQKALENTYQYFGPCAGGVSKYEFILHAMNVATVPGVSKSSTLANIRDAIAENDISTTGLKVDFTRK